VYDGRRGNFVGKVLQAWGKFSPHNILLADAVLDGKVDGKPNLLGGRSNVKKGLYIFFFMAEA
jgi:hypothetical protein